MQKEALDIESPGTHSSGCFRVLRVCDKHRSPTPASLSELLLSPTPWSHHLTDTYQEREAACIPCTSLPLLVPYLALLVKAMRGPQDEEEEESGSASRASAATAAAGTRFASPKPSKQSPRFPCEKTFPLRLLSLGILVSVSPPANHCLCPEFQSINQYICRPGLLPSRHMKLGSPSGPRAVFPVSLPGVSCRLQLLSSCPVPLIHTHTVAA